MPKQSNVGQRWRNLSLKWKACLMVISTILFLCGINYLRQPMSFRSRIHLRAAKLDPHIQLFEDKIEAKRIVVALGAPAPKTLFIVKSPDELSCSDLPSSYVIKPSHLSGSRGVMVINEGREVITKKSYTCEEILSLQKQWLSQQHYEEESTKSITPHLIVEEFMVPEHGDRNLPIEDFKCFVFGGRVGYIQWTGNRSVDGQERAFFTREWVRAPYRIRNVEMPTDEYVPPPQCLPDIIKWAEYLGTLAHGTFVRVDMYATARGAVFGEFTFHPDHGERFTSYGNKVLGDLWAQNEPL